MTTISRGRVVWENDKLTVTPGTGRFIPMKPFGPLFDGLEVTSCFLSRQLLSDAPQFTRRLRQQSQASPRLHLRLPNQAHDRSLFATATKYGATPVDREDPQSPSAKDEL